MARPLRIGIPGGEYHVTCRGLERRAIVRDDTDRNRWLSLLGKVADRREWRVLAWALMDNHFHVFVRTPAADISAGMHDLNSGYASIFNRRHARCGPLFQGRFKGIIVEPGHHRWELSRYVHLNPVRGGMVDRPEDYRWSSCREYLGKRQAPQWLAWEEVLAEHGRTLRVARRRYGRFLREGLTGNVPNPLADAVASTVLGSPSFVDRMRKWIGRLSDRDVPDARRLRKVLSLDDVAAAVADAFGVARDALGQRGRHGNEARSAAIYLSRKLTDASGRQIGAYFGGVGPSAVSSMARKVPQDRKRKPQLNATLIKTEAALREK